MVGTSYIYLPILPPENYPLVLKCGSIRVSRTRAGVEGAVFREPGSKRRTLFQIGSVDNNEVHSRTP